MNSLPSSETSPIPSISNEKREPVTFRKKYPRKTKIQKKNTKELEDSKQSQEKLKTHTKCNHTPHNPDKREEMEVEQNKNMNPPRPRE